ncbi:DUF4054 domain-containing protein [Paraburkholderia saeva]|uniref:DUF4054 domain-containing protein n=1 Tax=Paraburkholderia saeva TaxID=2777537 RepID=UPI001E1AEB99|nr:DUF4054 domain-containing protein [Paraburkholderia saeva]CAG4887961.1 hypothetical protein R52603_00546 [Paraburkholderia saeva]
MSTPAGVVTFDPAAFIVQFPAFATVPADTLTAYFDMATCYLDNSPCSIVQNLTVRAQLLNLITAHIAFLFGRINSGDGSNAAAVGQMTSASEGTVSAAFAPVQAKNAAFWAQSEYGMLFWQMALPYRTFRYFPAPVYVCR